MLYLLARPFDKEEMSMISDSGAAEGGVNVPLVNFIGKNGLVMSLEVRINPNRAENLPVLDPAKMNFSVDVNMESNSTEIVTAEKVVQVPIESKHADNSGLISPPTQDSTAGVPLSNDATAVVAPLKNAEPVKVKNASFAGKIKALFKSREKQQTSKQADIKLNDKTGKQQSANQGINDPNTSGLVKIHKKASKKIKKRHH